MLDFTGFTDEQVTMLADARPGELKVTVYAEAVRRGLVTAPRVDLSTQTPTPAQTGDVHPPDAPV